jgi:hypothetical protein
MEFALLVMGGFAALVAVLLAIGRYYPGSGAEQLDWQPTRSYEDEVRLELEDIDQMLELQNERRRHTGRPELTEDQVRAEVEGEERERRRRSRAYKAKGSRAGDAGRG